MGIEHRFFIVEASNRLVHFSSTAYNQLSIKDSDVSLPQYKNSELKYIKITLRNRDQKPVSVERTDCCYLKFDNEGKIEWDSWDMICKEAISSLKNDYEEKIAVKDPKIINASDLFKMKKITNRWRWELSAEMERNIIKYLFSQDISTFSKK